MSIRSQYLSGDDEEELFRLTAPEDLPDSIDESIAKLEEESLASSHYDDVQDELDEQAVPTNLEIVVQELSDAEMAEVVRLIEQVRNRRESDCDG